MDVLSGNQPAPGEMENLPFPAQTRQAAGVIGGVQTDVMAVSFSDKILVTISQNGRLAHWLHVPLENTNPATTVLGGRSGELESIGHLYACQIANAIATKNPSEKRLLVVGLGLDKLDADRDIFFGIIDLVLRCI
ncbi:conserved hypothetical protein [Coccidioides posadasii str. Silveira]|uniref:Proteasome assembly chaperone 3 n=1 Tax=Coccidioides posadasii (strain RMSCC 757 / Silveira) TaxID=443226 RepID=E9D3A5_COCPS|nr:conserved hypothetical protein [Coccidioides posadasii str. Silveira]